MARFKQNKRNSRVIAVVCSDIHLSHVPPIARSAEKDWYGVQKRYLDEIGDLCHNHNVPLLIAGDLFHIPDPPPSLINLAIQHLPETVYAVAGQHDLFHHNPNSFGETAYGTLVLSERIQHVHPDGSRLEREDAVIYGASWDQPLEWDPEPNPYLKILLAHRFCYFPGDKPFPGVDPNETAWDHAEQLKQYGFDVAFFGDHHQDFIYEADELPLIVNCGGVLLRSISEMDRNPKVYELLVDGKVNAVPLQSIEQDVWLDKSEIGERMQLEPTEISQFIHAIREVQEEELLSFDSAVMHYIRKRKPKDGVRTLLLKAIGRYEQ